MRGSDGAETTRVDFSFELEKQTRARLRASEEMENLSES